MKVAFTMATKVTATVDLQSRLTRKAHRQKVL